MNKKYLLIIQVILLLLYMIFFKHSNFIIQLIPSVFYGIVTLTIFKRSLEPSIQRRSWGFFSFLPLSLFLLHIIHFILLYIIKKSDITFFSIYNLQAIPNLLLLFALISFFITLSKINKWHRSRFLMDILVSFIILAAFTIPHLYRMFSNLQNDFGSIFIRMTYVMPSGLTVILVLVILISFNKEDRSNTISLLTIGFFIYHAGSVLTIGSKFLGLSVSLEYIIPVYMFALFVFFLAALIPNNNPRNLFPPEITDDTPKNFNNSYIIIIIFSAILAIILLIIGNISLLTFSIISTTIIIYLINIHAIQNVFISKLIMQKEKLDKVKLESLIQIRTTELRLANKELTKEATTDSLTGLMNRYYFIKSIEESITLGDEFSILLIDINHFKLINDVHGHNMGDYVLKTIADRIVSNAFSTKICSNYIFARIGGDGFAILSKTSDSSILKSLAEYIITFIQTPIKYEKYNFHIDISIGISSYPKDSEDAIKLMTCADISLHKAKEQKNGNHYFLYSLHLTEKIDRKNHITLLLKEADLLNDFELYYQPKFTADTGKIIGMEALIRWNHKTEGFISPAEFIPIAEETNIIIDMSSWIFETAMNQINKWNKTYSTNLIMSINLSPLSFNCFSFILDIQTLLATINVLPKWIEFEITEYSAMNSATNVEESLTALRNLGVGLSIDDFGTGYSSLAYLKRFNVNVIKIAKELIDNIVDDYEDQLIVNAIILMAKGLGLDTIAEGVETKEQLGILKELKCDSIQGYLLGRPMPANEFEKVINN